jgi:dihydrofolate reductase
MKLSLIAAIDENRGLGKNNTLLFKIPEDLKRFREVTKGHVIIMGRKTFESIGRPLPHRTNIVLTRDTSYKPQDVIVVHSIEEALLAAQPYCATNDEVFIIGGGELYRQTIDRADKLYLTLVKGSYDADTFFPDYAAFTKTLTKEEYHIPQFTFTFLVLTK